MADRSDFIESLRRLIGGEMDTVNTAIPCTVVSYNNGRVTVKPVGEKVYADGDSNAYPVLTDLRMQWPQFAGGQAGVKGPVQPGDECLLICCQQAIDSSGDTRKFDLIDSYVIPGCGYMDDVPGNDDMRLYYSNCFLALSADGKATLNAPGGFEVTAPMSKFNGEVTVANMFTYQGGMTGNGGSGSVADITGTMNVSGDVVINGIRIGAHKHPGDSGGTTGGPQN